MEKHNGYSLFYRSQRCQRYTTEELRKEFLIQNLYQPDTVQAVYSHVDRMVVLGIMPVNEALPIDKGIDVWANFGTAYFLERREAGVFNLGGAGWIEADGVRYELDFEDCLYITKGTEKVTFGSNDSAKPARFYLVSAPAHKVCKTTFISMKDANKRPAVAARRPTSGSSTSSSTPMCWRPASSPWDLPSWKRAASGTPFRLTPTSAAWRSTPTSTCLRTASCCT